MSARMGCLNASQTIHPSLSIATTGSSRPIKIILFGFIILFAMAFGFVWLQDRIYDKCREMRNEIRETNNKIFKENLETRNKIFAESQEIKKEIRETDNKIYTESREIKDEIIKTKWN